MVSVDGRIHRTVDDPRWLWRHKQTRRKVLAAGSLGFAAIYGTWFLFGRPRVDETNEVELIAAQFHPQNIAISVGDEVTWTNTEESPPETPESIYRLRSATDGWDFAADVGEGETASYKFDEAGVFALYDAEYGDQGLTGMSMKIGVDMDIEDPLGGWF